MKIVLSAIALSLVLNATAAAQELRPTYTELGELGIGARWPVESPRGRLVLYGAEGGLRVFDRASSTSLAFDETVADHGWSPRGDQVVFARVDEQQRIQIWTRPVDPRTGRPTGPPRRVSVRPGRGPAVSPDGRWIAYTVMPPSDSAAPRIAVVPATGGEERVLVRAPGGAQNLRWSPDGRWIYYRYRGETRPPFSQKIMRVPARGGDPQALLTVRDFLGVSPDGRFLAYFPADVDPADQRVVAIATADGVEVGRFALPHRMHPSQWSAAGLKLLAARRNDPSAVHALSFAGGPVRRVTTGRNFDLAPAWSPDGRRIAFASLFNDRYQLMVADARGGPRRQVPTRAEPGWGPPLWSPDGRYLAFLSPGFRELHVVELATGAEARLAGGGERIEEPTWRRDGRALLYSRMQEGRRELREVSLGGHETVLRAWSGDEGAAGALTFVGDSVFLLRTPREVRVGRIRGSGDRMLYRPGPGEELQPRGFGIEASRDGRWAAIPVLLPGPGGEVQDAIRLEPLGGGAGRTLPIGYLSYMGKFVWHPDGRHLMVLGTRKADRRMDVYLIPLNGEPPRPLTEADPSAYIDGFQASPDGSTLVYYAEGAAPSTLWEIDLTRALAPFLGPAQR
jgi:TolB protein